MLFANRLYDHEKMSRVKVWNWSLLKCVVADEPAREYCHRHQLKMPPKCVDLPDSNQLNHHCVKGNSSRFPHPPAAQQSKCRTFRHRDEWGFTTEEIQSHFWQVKRWLNVTQILNGSKFDFYFISQCRMQSCWNAYYLLRARFLPIYLCSTPLRCWF